MDGLTAHLASHGFLVIAPKFPLTSGPDIEKTDTNDIVNQSGDISFLLDAALGNNEAFPPFLRQLADSDRIAITGFSYGGLTTYFAAYDVKLRDPRVKLAIPIAGYGAELFEPLFYDASQVPLFLIYGTGDGFVDYQSAALTAFGHANKPKSLLTLKHGSHIGFIKTGLLSIIPVNTDSIACKMYQVDKEYDSEITPFNITLRNRRPDTGVGGAELIAPCTFGAEKQGHMASKWQREFTKIGVTTALQSYLNKSAKMRLAAKNYLANEFTQGQDNATLLSEQ